MNPTATPSGGKAPLWTNHRGEPISVGMTFDAPFEVIHQGHVVATYGADREAASAHYDQLCRSRLVALGIDPTPRKVHAH